MKNFIKVKTLETITNVAGTVKVIITKVVKEGTKRHFFIPEDQNGVRIGRTYFARKYEAVNYAEKFIAFTEKKEAEKQIEEIAPVEEVILTSDNCKAYTEEELLAKIEEIAPVEEGVLFTETLVAPVEEINYDSLIKETNLLTFNAVTDFIQTSDQEANEQMFFDVFKKISIMKKEIENTFIDDSTTTERRKDFLKKHQIIETVLSTYIREDRKDFIARFMEQERISLSKKSIELSIDNIDFATKCSFFLFPGWDIMVNEAVKKGYILRLSHTQIQWTEEGVKKADIDFSEQSVKKANTSPTLAQNKEVIQFSAKQMKTPPEQENKAETAIEHTFENGVSLNIEDMLKEAFREEALMELNMTGYTQDEQIYFVQFDDNNAVGSDGSVYKILLFSDYQRMKENDILDSSFVLLYKGLEQLYYYDDDQVTFEKEMNKQILNIFKKEAKKGYYGE